MFPGTSAWLSRRAHMSSTWFHKLCGSREARVTSTFCPRPLPLARASLSLWQLPGSRPFTLLATRALCVICDGFGGSALACPCAPMSLQTPRRGPSCTLTLLTPVPPGNKWRMAELAYSGDGPHPSLARASFPAHRQEAGKPSRLVGCSSASSVSEPENHFEDVPFGSKEKRENFKQSPG